jgi:hypothetical protein
VSLHHGEKDVVLEEIGPPLGVSIHAVLSKESDKLLVQHWSRLAPNQHVAILSIVQHRLPLFDGLDNDLGEACQLERLEQG